MRYLIKNNYSDKYSNYKYITKRPKRSGFENSVYLILKIYNFINFIKKNDNKSKFNKFNCYSLTIRLTLCRIYTQTLLHTFVSCDYNCQQKINA